MSGWTRVLGLSLLGVSALLGPHILPSFYVRLLTESLIFGMLAMSIDILAGYTGLVTLGHAGIFGISAYIAAYLTVKMGLPMYAVIPAGIAGALVVSLVFGALVVRTSGVYFLLITVAEGMLVWGLAFRWTSVTGSENGIRGVVRPEAFASYGSYYYLILVVFLIVAFLMWRIVRSPFGLTLQGVRESESRMRALGYSVWLHRLLGFLVAGFFAGVAGAFYAFHNNFVSPVAVHFIQSATGLLMVILGGTGTIIFTRNIVSIYTDRWPMVMGAIFVATILFAPDGLTGVGRRLLAWALPARREVGPRPVPFRILEALGLGGREARGGNRPRILRRQGK